MTSGQHFYVRRVRMLGLEMLGQSKAWSQVFVTVEEFS